MYSEYVGWPLLAVPFTDLFQRRDEKSFIKFVPDPEFEYRAGHFLSKLK